MNSNDERLSGEEAGVIGPSLLQGVMISHLQNIFPGHNRMLQKFVFPCLDIH